MVLTVMLTASVYSTQLKIELFRQTAFLTDTSKLYCDCIMFRRPCSLATCSFITLHYTTTYEVFPITTVNYRYVAYIKSQQKNCSTTHFCRNAWAFASSVSCNDRMNMLAIESSPATCHQQQQLHCCVIIIIIIIIIIIAIISDNNLQDSMTSNLRRKYINKEKTNKQNNQQAKITQA